MAQDLIPEGYEPFLRELKARVRQAQVRAAVAVNRELLALYWQMGREISKSMRQQDWGAKVIDRLARDLRAAFPEMKGFSPRNLRYMRAFAEAYPDDTILQPSVAKLSWSHNLILLDRVKDPTERAWYAQAAIEHGWSRDVMVLQIESGLYRRQAQAVSNFERALPAPRSDLARQMLKDPYPSSPRGRVNQKVEPWPGVPRTPTRPPWRVMMSRLT